MKSFRVAKPTRKTKSFKPRLPFYIRVSYLADNIEVDLSNIAIVAYLNYVNEDVLCYYNRE